MSNYEIALKIIKKNFDKAECGIYNTRNIVFDPMDTLYDNNGLKIDICYKWEYFEVFGLTEEEFRKLETEYNYMRYNY